jgi:hypothetical protein
MKRTNRNRASLAGLLCAVLLTISCGPEAPTAPARPSADLRGGGLGEVTRKLGTLLSCSPLPYAENSAVIGPDGGTLRIGPHTLTIPARALAKPTRISGEAPSGSVRLVELEPHGLKFAQPASLTLSYAQCSLVAGLLPRVAYTNNALDIQWYTPSVNDIFAQTVTGKLEHFSGYATAW